jgi:hypothetical protein
MRTIVNPHPYSKSLSHDYPSTSARELYAPSHLGILLSPVSFTLKIPQ